MRCHYACGSAEHFSRRSFLGGLAGGALGTIGFRGMVEAKAAEDLKSRQRQVVVFWLSGGVSQLETWDPKPGADTGGPFQAIETSAPGVQVCELLPFTARQMHHIALVRGVNTNENDHGKGAYIMHTGRRETPGFEYPFIGSVFSAQLCADGNPLPGNLCVGGGGGPQEAAFLGPKHVPVTLGSGSAPPNLALPGGLTDARDQQRRDLRARVSNRFIQGRRTADAEVYDSSYDQAAALVAKRDLFDFSKIPDTEFERYGKHDFGRYCLIARKLVESGATFVKVSHSNYDTHSENFSFHFEQLGEFDRPFATFIADLADRGLLEHTLVVVMCEFGRTPKINARLGRDHWGTAWSVALAGAGIKGGVVSGKTNDNGTQVIDREVNGGHLFHTYYRAVGLDPTEQFWHNDRPIDKADPAASAITEILA